LEEMASLPYSTYVTTLKSFAIINQLINQMTSSTCGSPTVVQPGSQTTSNVNSCEVKYFQPQCGSVTSSLVIEIVDVVGSTNAYISSVDSLPGPFSFEQAAYANTTRKTFKVVRSAADIRPLYIGVEGASTRGSNQFTINVWSGMLPYSCVLI
jgi:hypothetical protein